MKFALRELNYGKKKYILIEILLVLLMFMVLFLSGLAEGLGRAVTSGIEDMEADYFLMNPSADQLITVSELDVEIYEHLKDQFQDEIAQGKGEIAVLDIQRLHLSKQGQEEKMNITYFAIEPGSFLEPDVVEGTGLKKDENAGVYSIILDDDFRLEGIEIGDKVQDADTGLAFQVVGFAKDQMYGHTSVGFISTEAYTELRTLFNPMYQQKYHTIVLKGNIFQNLDMKGVEMVSKQEVIGSIPSYAAEHTTITMIVWVLVVVSSIIIGIFYYILTLQKRNQFGVMKALGMSMGKLAGVVVSQVSLLAVCAAVVSNLMTFTMAAMLPQTMPFYLKIGNACLVTAVFVVVAIFSSLISIVNIAKVDPIMVIGGAEE